MKQGTQNGMKLVNVNVNQISSVCVNKQCWNNAKCRCECKELIDKGIYDKGFIWNPSISEFGFDKSCDIREYLDYENCTCRKRLIDKFVEECSESIDENEIFIMIKKMYVILVQYTFVVLFVIAFLIIIGISSVFIYFHSYLKRDTNIMKIDKKSYKNIDIQLIGYQDTSQ